MDFGKLFVIGFCVVVIQLALCFGIGTVRDNLTMSKLDKVTSAPYTVVDASTLSSGENIIVIRDAAGDLHQFDVNLDTFYEFKQQLSVVPD